MRNFILASAVALAATLTTGVAARADQMSMHKPHHQHCMMKTVKHRDGHGHWVMKKMRVCR
jgi:hypothetical protein